MERTSEKLVYMNKMNKSVFSIRGATTVDANTSDSIAFASVELFLQMVKKNNLNREHIVNVIISSTEDLTAAYPAKAIRESGYSDIPLFSCLEPDVDNALEKCIRILATVANFSDVIPTPKHIYLHGAKTLRPDLAD
jgi:chorismate mutase